ncbi:hypothetical protein MX572_25930 (plasmid) [Rhodococcus pyridinivorans]|uniref:hypothetical protein n=1 Tax=Rhodococcus pyridinivorans TaxID=103816 RepID=UPI0020C6FC3B|nr:hypothetical protein [Rhodococcus pyridinivorans]UTM40089.1 hypothetical protein MX572_25930 [Rhodococcus pyridinivorans]
MGQSNTHSCWAGAGAFCSIARSRVGRSSWALAAGQVAPIVSCADRKARPEDHFTPVTYWEGLTGRLSVLVGNTAIFCRFA